MSKTPKPILLIGIPVFYSDEAITRFIDAIKKNSIKKDYHVLAYTLNDNPEVTFKILNPNTESLDLKGSDLLSAIERVDTLPERPPKGEPRKGY